MSVTKAESRDPIEEDPSWYLSLELPVVDCKHGILCGPSKAGIGLGCEFGGIRVHRIDIMEENVVPTVHDSLLLQFLCTSTCGGDVLTDSPLASWIKFHIHHLVAPGHCESVDLSPSDAPFPFAQLAAFCVPDDGSRPEPLERKMQNFGEALLAEFEMQPGQWQYLNTPQSSLIYFGHQIIIRAQLLPPSMPPELVCVPASLGKDYSRKAT